MENEETTIEIDTDKNHNDANEFPLIKMALLATLVAAIYVGTPVIPGKSSSSLKMLPPSASSPSNLPVSSNTIAAESITNRTRKKTKPFTSPQKLVNPIIKSQALTCLRELNKKTINEIKNPFPRCKGIFSKHPTCDEIQYRYAYRLFLLSYALQQSFPKISLLNAKESIGICNSCHSKKFKQLRMQTKSIIKGALKRVQELRN